MVIWMVYDRADYKKNKSYYHMHVEHGKKYNIDFKVIFSDEYTHVTSSLPDAVIMRSRNYRISEYYESLGILVYNNSYISKICNDKYLTYKEVSKLDVPCIETTIVENIQNLMENINLKNICDNGLDLDEFVIKSVDGHGGNEVYFLKEFLNNYYPNEKIISVENGESFKGQNFNILKDDKRYIIQPLIRNSGKDLRVYVLNGRIVGSVLRISTDSFKSNYSLGGNIEAYELSTDEEKYVYMIIEHFNNITEKYSVSGLFYVGIDFIIDENGRLLFNEIEDVVGSRMLYNTSEVDIVELYIATIVEQLRCKNI